MNTARIFSKWLLTIVIAVAGVAHANVVYTVNLNTTAISGAANYAIAFSFQDGAGTSDNNNSATLSNFGFGGGSATGSPVTGGGASGSASSTVTLKDSAFSSFLVQGFTPGTSLSFTIELTTNVDAGAIPDFFGFSLLFNTNPLATLDDTGGDNLLYFNIDSSNPKPAVWATDPASPVSLSAPIVRLAALPAQVPEPGSLSLLLAGLMGLVGLRRRGAIR